MSFYNMLFGMNGELAMHLSILLNERVEELFPRFRNVFTETDDDEAEGVDYDFVVYTRMGGGNRECWGDCSTEEPCPACISDEIESREWVVKRYDDDFDYTYTNFLVKIPEEMKNITEDEKKARFERLFPKLVEKMKEKENEEDEGNTD